MYCDDCRKVIQLLIKVDKKRSIDNGSEREAVINPNDWFLNYLVDGSINIFIINPGILSIPDKGKRFLFFPHSSDRLWRPTQPPIQWVQLLFRRRIAAEA
jgi:hypothetical protein